MWAKSQREAIAFYPIINCELKSEVANALLLTNNSVRNESWSFEKAGKKYDNISGNHLALS